MQIEHKATLLRSVRARLSEARHLVTFVDLDSDEADLINTLIDVTELAVTDCMQGSSNAA